MRPYTGWRDRLVVWVANRILKLASRRLQDTIQALIQLGMNVEQQKEKTV